MLTSTQHVQFIELSAKILESTGRLLLLRRKLLKRGHNTTFSKAAARLSKDIKERVLIAVKWHRAAAKLFTVQGVREAVSHSDQAVAEWVQAPWLTQMLRSPVEDAAKAAVDVLLGGDDKELGAHFVQCMHESQGHCLHSVQRLSSQDNPVWEHFEVHGCHEHCKKCAMSWS